MLFHSPEPKANSPTLTISKVMKKIQPVGIDALRLFCMGLLMLSLGCASASFDAKTPHAKNLNLGSASLALSGHDPVSYFDDAAALPLRGKALLSVDFRGATYRFVDAYNRQAFLEDPQRYAPAYGGWCAWAMVDGEKIEVDPSSYLIQDGRLLLFYDGFFADTKMMWTKAQPVQLGLSADREWKALLTSVGMQEVASQEAGSMSAADGAGAADATLSVDPAGDGKFISRFNGKLYRFKSASDRLVFLSHPERHLRAQSGASRP